MTRVAALLPLSLALVASSAAAEPLEGLELLPLPKVHGPVTVSADPFERTVTVEAPHGTPAIARALGALSPALCPEVTERPGRTVLTCRSSRVVARIAPRGALHALELRELRGLPGTGDVAIPVTFHDPLSLGLGSCPGANHAARGECRLRAENGELARGSFLTASRSSVAAEREHALLRLGDLALASGDTEEALRYWSAVELQPWKRMVDARRCELSADCLASEGDAPFAREGLPVSMAREMVLRSARARAFAGDPAAAAWALADQLSGAGACTSAGELCRRIVLSALRSRDEAQAREALAIYVAAVKPGDAPLHVELAIAAAAVAARSHAPAFAAALLSSVSRSVPADALTEHLLRTAELYVEAGDPVRARVVVDFLEARREGAVRRGARWAALLRDIAALRTRRRDAPTVAAPSPSAASPELVAASRALGRARAIDAPHDAERACLSQEGRCE